MPLVAARGSANLSLHRSRAGDGEPPARRRPRERRQQDIDALVHAQRSDVRRCAAPARPSRPRNAATSGLDPVGDRHGGLRGDDPRLDVTLAHVVGRRDEQIDGAPQQSSTDDALRAAAHAPATAEASVARHRRPHAERVVVMRHVHVRDTGRVDGAVHRARQPLGRVGVDDVVTRRRRSAEKEPPVHGGAPEIRECHAAFRPRCPPAGDLGVSVRDDPDSSIVPWSLTKTTDLVPRDVQRRRRGPPRGCSAPPRPSAGGRS